MLAETTPLQAHPHSVKPLSWAGVLGVAVAVFLGSSILGLFGGLPLFLGLMAWLAGPDALSGLPDNYDNLPAEAQALLLGDGLVLCTSLFAVPIGIALLRLAVPRQGATVREYLGLKWPGLRQGLGWTLILLISDYGYLWLASSLGFSFGKDDRYREVFGIPLFLPLLFISIAILTPIYEELLFRGYLLEGLRQSRLGEAGAILIPTLLWTVLHLGTPVRWVGLFLYGCLLALARLRTGSTYLVMLIHAIGNVVAVISSASG